MTLRNPLENTLQIVASPENVEIVDKARMFFVHYLDWKFFLSGSSCPMVMIHATHTCSLKLKRTT